MKTNDRIRTPRFGIVQIREMFATEKELRAAGYTETTHYQDAEYVVLGKSLDMYHMLFAAARKENFLCR